MALLLLAFLSTNVAAQDRLAEKNQAEKGWRPSLSLTHYKLESGNTTNQGLGDSAYGLDLIGTYYFSSNLAASIGIGVINIEDNNSFSETVESTTPFGSDTETLKSSATGLPLFAEVNYQNTLIANTPLRFRIGGGFKNITNSTRGVINCVECTSDELDIDGGAYANLGAFYTSRKQHKTGVTLKQYFSGDVKNSVILWFELAR